MDERGPVSALERIAGAIGWVVGIGTAALGLLGLALLGRRRRKVAAPVQAAGPEHPPFPRDALPPQPEPRRTAPAASSPEPERRPSSPDAVPPVRPDEDPSATAKLDLGPAPRAEPPVEHVPWSYGVDRVTAAAVDPQRLYVYWEVTDEAISLARARLGAAGPGGWLSLRVYDTTGLIFDGSNAHGWLDQGVDRSDRQWFFTVGKPTSTAVVEIGWRTADGGFGRIARSGRVDFPRVAPADASEPEWMTVVTAAGPVEPPRRGERAGTRGGGEPSGVGLAGAAPEPGEAAEGFTPIPLWVLHAVPAARETQVRELPGGGWERVTWHEVVREGWIELRGEVQWHGPVSESRWEEGPLPDPVEVLEPEREEWQGRSFAYDVGGVKHVVFGPWEVVIRNLGMQVSRAVLARWHVYRSWVAERGREVVQAPAGSGSAAAARPAGASEWVALGASERQWLGASELRLGGASELWRMGASELRLRGASERLLAGASERMLQGASERIRQGASERLHAGGSERLRVGASEHRLAAAAPGDAPAPPGPSYPSPGE